MRRLPVVALVLLALALAVPGILGIFAPRMFAGALYAQPLGVDALNEMRAVAGTRIGIAIVLAYAAWATGWTRRGLAIGCVVFGLTLFGRLLSTTLDGLPTPMLKPEIAEAVLIALALVALRAAPSPEPPLGR